MTFNPYVTNLTSVSTDLGGTAPPEGAHRFNIANVDWTQNNDGSPAFKLSVNVAAGEHLGKGMSERFSLPTGDQSKDGFKLNLLTRLAKAVRVPANMMANLDWQKLVPQLLGKSFVGFVVDDEARTAADGRRRYNMFPVLPEDENDALAGNWTPHGGRGPKAPAPGFNAGGPPQGQPQGQQPQGQQPQQPMQPQGQQPQQSVYQQQPQGQQPPPNGGYQQQPQQPQQPQGGGFDGLFGGGGNPMP